MKLFEKSRHYYRKVYNKYPIRNGHHLYWPLFWLRWNLKKNLNVELKHGLANRLGTLITCQVAGDMLGKKFHFTWLNNKLCGCDFNDLFENKISVIKQRRIIDFNDDTTCQPAFLTKSKTFLFSKKGFNNFSKVKNGQWDLNNIPFISGVRDSSAEQFSLRLNELKPIGNVLNLVPTIPDNAIGVHIRRMDLPWQIHSPVKAFCEYIDRLTAENSDLRIFLASDDLEVKRKICKQFDDKIITIEEIGKREDKTGIQLALADMIALSRTKKIFGTFNSSFSWLSTMWRMIDLEMIVS